MFTQNVKGQTWTELRKAQIFLSTHKRRCWKSWYWQEFSVFVCFCLWTRGAKQGNDLKTYLTLWTGHAAQPALEMFLRGRFVMLITQSLPQSYLANLIQLHSIRPHIKKTHTTSINLVHSCCCRKSTCYSINFELWNPESSCSLLQYYLMVLLFNESLETFPPHWAGYQIV